MQDLQPTSITGAFWTGRVTPFIPTVQQCLSAPLAQALQILGRLDSQKHAATAPGPSLPNGRLFKCIALVSYSAIKTDATMLALTRLTNFLAGESSLFSFLFGRFVSGILTIGPYEHRNPPCKGLAG
jgi:hypothetical protein